MKVLVAFAVSLSISTAFPWYSREGAFPLFKDVVGEDNIAMPSSPTEVASFASPVVRPYGQLSQQGVASFPLVRSPPELRPYQGPINAFRPHKLADSHYQPYLNLHDPSRWYHRAPLVQHPSAVSSLGSHVKMQYFFNPGATEGGQGNPGPFFLPPKKDDVVSSSGSNFEEGNTSDTIDAAPEPVNIKLQAGIEPLLSTYEEQDNVILQPLIVKGTGTPENVKSSNIDDLISDQKHADNSENVQLVAEVTAGEDDQSREDEIVATAADSGDDVILLKGGSTISAMTEIKSGEIAFFTSVDENPAANSQHVLLTAQAATEEDDPRQEDKKAATVADSVVNVSGNVVLPQGGSTTLEEIKSIVVAGLTVDEKPAADSQYVELTAQAGAQEDEKRQEDEKVVTAADAVVNVGGNLVLPHGGSTTLEEIKSGDVADLTVDEKPAGNSQNVQLTAEAVVEDDNRKQDGERPADSVINIGDAAAPLDEVNTAPVPEEIKSSDITDFPRDEEPSVGSENMQLTVLAEKTALEKDQQKQKVEKVATTGDPILDFDGVVVLFKAGNTVDEDRMESESLTADNLVDAEKEKPAAQTNPDEEAATVGKDPVEEADTISNHYQKNEEIASVENGGGDLESVQVTEYTNVDFASLDEEAVTQITVDVKSVKADGEKSGAGGSLLEEDKIVNDGTLPVEYKDPSGNAISENNQINDQVAWQVEQEYGNSDSVSELTAGYIKKDVAVVEDEAVTSTALEIEVVDGKLGRDRISTTVPDEMLEAPA